MDKAALKQAALALVAAIGDDDDDDAREEHESREAEALADAVADTAEAVADAVADAVPDPVIIETSDPSPSEEAAAEVALIEARTESEVTLMREAADIRREDEDRYQSQLAAEREREAEDSLAVLDDVLGPIEDVVSGDESPAPGHFWFRKRGGRKK